PVTEVPTGDVIDEPNVTPAVVVLPNITPAVVVLPNVTPAVLGVPNVTPAVVVVLVGTGLRELKLRELNMPGAVAADPTGIPGATLVTRPSGTGAAAAPARTGVAMVKGPPDRRAMEATRAACAAWAAACAAAAA